MLEKPIISVKNVSKMYRIGHRSDTLRDTLGNLFKKKRNVDSFWALKNISFDVNKEEILGIIGLNGAGKTTLLKILSRITYATSGEVRLRGRVASLLEVGTGFHGELTGRENIYLNGAILGMKKREIDQKYDEIIKFSGVEQFLDTPVKRYSSGMYVRLAFAVAAHLEPEILLIDEVLAVGDIRFQQKCLGRMKAVTESGRTVLFVSHNMRAISNLCQKAMLLDQGEIIKLGETETVVKHYLEDFQDQMMQLSLAERADRVGRGDVILTDIQILDTKTRESINSIASGQDLLIEISYEARDKTKN
ncbi:MAG: polysaccharide ABC transporter ATP-binding protein, partial [Candidatus Hodarchaeota archaeon]